MTLKKLLLSFTAAGLLAAGSATLLAQAETKEKKAKKKAPAAAVSESAPKSVVHVVTVAWKEGTTEEQIKAALDGVKAMPAKFPGLTRVWTKTVKIQNQKGAETKLTNVIAMEFADEAALKAYAGSPAQLEWYKLYEPIRLSSTTHDVSN
jgi:tagatose-1,6-bisphosphate aldolase non-catalytic subunit AgaZ/GatZ